jgi:hypothetical protein
MHPESVIWGVAPNLEPPAAPSQLHDGPTHPAVQVCLELVSWTAALAEPEMMVACPDRDV